MAQDFLRDVGQFFEDTAGKIGRDFDNAVNNAGNAINQAGNLVQSAFQGGKITGPLGEIFGKDPVQFALNSVKHFDSDMRAIANRVAKRKSITNFDAPTATGKSVKIPATVKKSDSSAHVALVICLDAINFPGELIDEMGREQHNLPVGPRGLNGPVAVWPCKAHGLFGIDDALLLAAVVPLLIAVAPAILAALVSIVGAVVGAASSAIGAANPLAPADAGGGKKADTGPLEILLAPSDLLLGLPPVALILAGAGVIGLVLLLKKKKS